jgi:hypothetical protein
MVGSSRQYVHRMRKRFIRLGWMNEDGSITEKVALLLEMEQNLEKLKTLGGAK